MRNAFASEVTALGGRQDSLVLLSGDIGNRLFDDFKNNFPDRFFNCGVAEANMISLAAGMAMSGLKPVAYTINSFITARCYEQIKLDMCYHNLPVIIVGVGAGLGYASLGATHHSCEDIAIMRVLPHMTVLCPGDPVEVRLALREAVKINGPVFIRIGKKGEPVVHKTPPTFSIGKVIPVRAGTGVCLISTGNVLPVAVDAAEVLDKKGFSTHVASCPSVKPLDQVFLKDAFSRFKIVATIEEHSVIGGLGGAVAEWLADQPAQQARLMRFGAADEFLHEAGEQEHARQHFGLTPEAIARKIEKTIQAS